MVKDLKTIEEDNQGVQVEYTTDPSDVLIKGTKVYTKNIDLNEDAVLSNLSGEMAVLAKYVIEQQTLMAILHSYLKVNHTFIKVSNDLDEWKKEIKYKNPNFDTYEGIKKIFMSRIHAMLILSRSKEGAVLKAFLKYGQNQNVDDKELGLDKKLSKMDRLMGKKQQEVSEI